jgi:hypothetical protein
MLSQLQAAPCFQTLPPDLPRTPVHLPAVIPGLEHIPNPERKEDRKVRFLRFPSEPFLACCAPTSPYQDKLPDYQLPLSPPLRLYPVGFCWSSAKRNT